MFLGRLRWALALLILVALLIIPSSGSIQVVEAQGPPNVTIPNPPTDGWVLDNLGWFSADQKERTNRIIIALDREAQGAQIAVVLLNDCGTSVEEFATNLFRNWGIGQKKTNNGVLLLYCWYNGDANLRKLRTETGYGAEGPIPDILAKQTQEKYFAPVRPLPFDKESNSKRVEAFISIVSDYDKMLRGEYQPDKSGTNTAPSSGAYDWLAMVICFLPVWVWIVIIVLGIFILWAMAGFPLPDEGSGGYGGSSSSSGDSGGGGWGGGGGSSGGGGATSSG